MDDKIEQQVKPFCEYEALVSLLKGRGMVVPCEENAARKIAQIGYYRLSGYWFTSRNYDLVGKKRQYKDSFRSNTCFDEVVGLYLFDKRLRIEFTDALERIEIYFRTIIAHEMGRVDPLAYLNERNFIRTDTNLKSDGSISNYTKWFEKQNNQIYSCKEECIKQHLASNKPIPVWVAAEAWSFGTLSHFYGMLKTTHKDKICVRLGFEKEDRNVLGNWLIVLSGIRNRCAHHARLWNNQNPRRIMLPKKGYFNLLDLNDLAKDSLYGAICIVWFLLNEISSNSKWLHRVVELIDSIPSLPGCEYADMGFMTEGFPMKLFPEVNKDDESDDKNLADLYDDCIKVLNEVKSSLIEPVDQNYTSREGTIITGASNFETLLMDSAVEIEALKQEK